MTLIDHASRTAATAVPVDSLMPRGEKRETPLLPVARHLADQVLSAGAASRDTQLGDSELIGRALAEFCEAYGSELGLSHDLDALAELITAQIAADDCLDGSRLRVARGFSRVLSQALGSKQISISGWMPGLVVAHDPAFGERLMLTGTACPRCGTNPLVQGTWETAASRCLNAAQCGYQKLR